jgi:hypothetical protein
VQVIAPVLRGEGVAAGDTIRPPRPSFGHAAWNTPPSAEAEGWIAALQESLELTLHVLWQGAAPVLVLELRQEIVEVRADNFLERPAAARAPEELRGTRPFHGKGLREIRRGYRLRIGAPNVILAIDPESGITTDVFAAHSRSLRQRSWWRFRGRRWRR